MPHASGVSGVRLRMMVVRRQRRAGGAARGKGPTSCVPPPLRWCRAARAPRAQRGGFCRPRPRLHFPQACCERGQIGCALLVACGPSRGSQSAHVRAGRQLGHRGGCASLRALAGRPPPIERLGGALSQCATRHLALSPLCAGEDARRWGEHPAGLVACCAYPRRAAGGNPAAPGAVNACGPPSRGGVHERKCLCSPRESVPGLTPPPLCQTLSLSRCRRPWTRAAASTPSTLASG